jgi:diguanylate cyclase (GGDEF)-like protein
MAKTIRPGPAGSSSAKDGRAVVATGATVVRSTKKGAEPEVETVVARLEQQLAAAQARIVELETHADTDFLLGILNRRGFARELRRAMAYARRYQATAAVIYLDVDGLKPVNDRFGHAAGDVLLQTVATVLQRLVRESDVVARLGGDEFGLLLWHLSERDAALKALALEAAVDGTPCDFGGQRIMAGISAGIAMIDGSDDAEQVLQRADRAMYARKAERLRRSRG